MHPALEIPEILLSVCNALVAKKEGATGDGPYDVHARALAACARTCRAFYMPAILALWKYDGLMLETILLHCMPEDVWERRPNTLRYLGCAELFYPKRPILPTDTERLMFYAPLVNKLSVGHPVDDIHDREREVGLSEEGYEAIVSVLPHPVFVNLRHLVWHTLCGGLSHIQQYLSPSLRSLTLKLSWDARPHISLLSDLADRCPFVTSFHLDTEFKSYDVEDNDELKVLHSRLIRAWDLHSLRSDLLAHSSLIFLSQSSHLTRLVTSPQDTLRWIPLSLPPKAFAFLCYLHLGNIEMRLCLELLQASTFTALGSLSLSLLNVAAGDWKRLYAAIRAAHAQPQLLYSLGIEEWDPKDDNIEVNPVTDDQIMPLLDFTELCELSMQTLDGFDLEPVTLERMATAWPAVERLSLRSTIHLEWQRRLTVYALVPLAMHCPDLRDLDLEIDGTGVSFDQNLPDPSTLSPLSPIHDSRAVASFLSIYFPQLASIHSNANRTPGELWRHIRKLVKKFSSMGDHERIEAVDDYDLQLDFSSDEEDD